MRESANNRTENRPTNSWVSRAQKGAFFGPAADHGLAILFPDTSPRGAGIEGEDDDWDFGTGAGFYLNATNPKYAKHYNMYTHVAIELPQVLEANGLPIVSYHLSPPLPLGILLMFRMALGLEQTIHLWS
jgi:phage tail protein X